MSITGGLFTDLIILLFFVPSILKNFKKRKYDKILFITLLFIYVKNLISYVVFPIFINSSIADDLILNASIWERLSINLEYIPFYVDNIYEFFLNIILTFPLGCFLPVFYKNITYKKSALFGLFLGILFESIKLMLFFIQGFTFRIISINDVLANTIGLLLGYTFFVFCLKTFLYIYKNKSMPKYISYLSREIIDNNKNIKPL